MTAISINIPVKALGDPIVHTEFNALKDGVLDSQGKESGKGLSQENYTTTEKQKLSGIAAGATANATDAQLRDRATHTGSISSSVVSDFTEAVQDAVAALLGAGTNVTLIYNDAGNSLTITAAGGGGSTDPEAVRDAIGVALLGVGLISVAVNDAGDTITITTTATANDTDANLKARANHIGVQTASTISDFATAADARITAQKGIANGLVPLDSGSQIAAIYLPSYVDDVLEFTNLAGFPGSGATGKIYVALDTNKTYRWSGSAYVEISASPGSTDSVTEGATNKYFTESRVLNALLTGLVTTTNRAIAAGDTILVALGLLQRQITDNTTAISGKQATLVSGTNFKTVNNQSLLGPGDLAIDGSPPTAATVAAATALNLGVGKLVYVTETDALYVKLAAGLLPLVASE